VNSPRSALASLLITFGILLPFLPVPASAQDSSSDAPAAKKSAPAKKTVHKKTASGKKKSTATSASTRTPSRTRTKKKKRVMSPRVRRVRQQFVASTSLRPMARQLLADRTPAAYVGVETYARRHSGDNAGALAWLAVGYARVLDHDYARAIEPLSRAKPHAEEFADYVNFYLGTAYAQSGRTAEAIATLSTFEQNFPDSLFRRDANISYANLLMQENRAQEAIVVLEKNRPPVRSDLELSLGRAYVMAGEPAKALAIFRTLYLAMPLSPEADLAGTEISKLAGQTQAAPPSVDERRIRADLLYKGKRYSDAAREYQGLIYDVPVADRVTIQLAMASALQKAGRGHEARQMLDSLQGLSTELDAQRHYLLGEIARSSDDEAAFLSNLALIRQQAASSPWLEQALLSAGNIYLLKKDYDKAIDAYRELQQRFPNGNRASYAHWKAAWLTMRQGRNDEAKKEFEEQIAWYPASNEVPAALYWRARLAAEDGESAKARAFYQKISDRFRNYYYADLAREEIKKLPDTAEPVQFALLDKIPPIDIKLERESDDVPTDNLRYQKAQLLGNGGLIELAARELQAAASEENGWWAAPETAHLYQENQRYDRGIEVMKRAFPNYFAVDIPALPRSYWEALFPRAYWSDLKRYSVRNELDPFLVASLVRQESEFNAGAISHANAVGLMQLLPKTGKLVAKQEKMRRFSPNQLLTPGVNLQLGTRYFRSMVDKFGSFEYALAAYNAGSDRVEDWLAQGKFRDPQEFVESIPFTETREYVQAIMRNAAVYRQLYGTP
jgi:soluble lytic murein transglycosylase